jgi:hypothetical protein
MKKLFTIMFAGAFLFSACGPEAEPTMSAADVQGTAVAAAWTIVAETQAAIPTATPIPPTDTPVPTSPPVLLPTQPISVLPTNTVSSQTTTSGDICNDYKHIIPEGADGPRATIKMVNEYNVPATISIYLNKTPFGECGYRSYQLGKNGGSVVASLPQGCYSAWAWSTDPKKSFNASGSGMCINNPDKWTFVIRSERIVMLSP